jgi:hypothetical protein
MFRLGVEFGNAAEEAALEAMSVWKAQETDGHKRVWRELERRQVDCNKGVVKWIG